MESRYSGELALTTELIYESGKLARQLFYSDGFEVFDKGGSKVTSIDFAVHNRVVRVAQSRGRRVRSEEKGSTAKYGDNKVFDLDPIDSTNDLIEGYERNPRRSNAAPALGFWDEEPVVGAVTFPVLGVNVPPITYTASKGGGAYREQGGHKVRFKLDTAPTRGIVLVTSKTHTASAQAVSRALSSMGYTPMPDHGAVFKACCVADRELLRQYPYSGVYASGLPVVGFVTLKAHLHDIAATTRIVREAGGVTSSPLNREGKQPWMAANNQVVYNDLMKLHSVR